MFHHHPVQILKWYKKWSCQLRCHLSAARWQLGRSVLAQHIAIVSWAAKCQLIGRLSAPLRFASSASNAQLQSLGSIPTCQLSLTLYYANSAAICQLSSIAMCQLKCTLSAQLSLVISAVGSYLSAQSWICQLSWQVVAELQSGESQRSRGESAGYSSMTAAMPTWGLHKVPNKQGFDTESSKGLRTLTVGPAVWRYMHLINES